MVPDIISVKPLYSWDEGTVKNISIIGDNQLTVVS